MANEYLIKIAKPTTLNPVPSKIRIEGKDFTLLSTMENIHHRALVLPVNGGDPVWLNNEQVGKLIEEVGV